MAVAMFGVVSTVGGSCPLCGWCELPLSGVASEHSASAGGQRDCGELSEGAGIQSGRGREQMAVGLCGLCRSPAGAQAGENTDRCELGVVFRVVGEGGN